VWARAVYAAGVASAVALEVWPGHGQVWFADTGETALLAAGPAAGRGSVDAGGRGLNLMVARAVARAAVLAAVQVVGLAAVQAAALVAAQAASSRAVVRIVRRL
jgi:hypothetical protein